MTLLGYQVPDTTDPLANIETPDSLARRIDAAVAAVPADKRGTFLVAADLSRASLAVMVRVGKNVSFLGRVSKPYTADPTAEAILRVNFAKGERILSTPLTTIDYYHALRAERDGFKRNGKFRAFVKALALNYFKARPFLDGALWFERDMFGDEPVDLGGSNERN